MPIVTQGLSVLYSGTPVHNRISSSELPQPVRLTSRPSLCLSTPTHLSTPERKQTAPPPSESVTLQTCALSILCTLTHLILTGSRALATLYRSRNRVRKKGNDPLKATHLVNRGAGVEPRTQYSYPACCPGHQGRCSTISHLMNMKVPLSHFK